MDDATEELTALDQIAASITVFAILFSLQFPFLYGPRFAAMFRDFGNGALPLLTRLVLTRWFPIVLTVPPVVLLLLSRRAAKLRRRRALITSAFLAACAAGAFCLIAVYLPILSLAGNVRP
jgi:hypothetical protein